MRYRRLVLAMAAILAMGNAPVLAQAVAHEHPMTEAEQSLWPAIGQISYGNAPGGAICTGTLVAADLVLTAGHCVAVGGVAMQPADVKFAAGWRAGRSLAVRQGKMIVLAQPSVGQERTLAQDVALLILAAPIDMAIARPLPLSRHDLVAERYSMIGYRLDAPGIIRLNAGCDLAGTQPGIVLLDCPVVSGNSGAPILMNRHGVWQVAAVVVAAARGAGPVRSYAVIPGDDLRARIAGN